MKKIKFVILNCQNCGGALQIDASATRLTCGCCGRAQRVIRKGGAISLKLISSAAKVSLSAERAAAKLAIRIHTKDLKQAYARKHQVEREGVQTVKALWQRFKKRALCAVAAPLIIAVLLSEADSRYWQSTQDSDTSLYIGSLVMSGVVMVALFFFGWPTMLDRVEAAKRATQNELSDLDARITESQAVVTHNNQIANSKGG
jgi:hypothetical protein